VQRIVEAYDTHNREGAGERAELGALPREGAGRPAIRSA
jgi:hypothetical protein